MRSEQVTTLEEIRRIGEERGDRVLLRAVRRPVRAAEREARSRPRTSTTSSRTARASPASRRARSARLPSDPDIAAMPDLASFTPVPWQPNLARFACDVTVEGEEWPYCPRTILRSVARAGRGAGLRVQDRASSSSTSSSAGARTASIEIADALDTLEKPCYDIAGLTRHYDFLTTVSRYCNELGWGNYANDHEDANGQFEQNFDVRRRARRAATARSSSATWCTRSPSSTGWSRRSCRSRSRT